MINFNRKNKIICSVISYVIFMSYDYFKSINTINGVNALEQMKNGVSNIDLHQTFTSMYGGACLAIFLIALNIFVWTRRSNEELQKGKANQKIIISEQLKEKLTQKEKNNNYVKEKEM